MDERQKAALKQLYQALREATESGLLDEMAGQIHFDTINAFCDAVADMEEQHG